MTRSLDDKLDEIAQKYDKDANGTYDLNEVRAIVRDLLESNVEKRRFKGLALGLTALTALALTALVVLGAVIISLLRDYDKEETDENLPAVQMNGNIVGTRAVTTTLPLLAATAMGMARLEQVKSVLVSILVFGELPSFLVEYKTLGLLSYGFINQIYNVAGVTKISDTAVIFQTDVCGHAVVIADGAASLRVVGADGNVTTARLCTSGISCGAIQVESSEEEARLMEKARGDLAASPSRRLEAEEGCFDPATHTISSYTTFSCGDGEDSVCAEAKKIKDTCGTDEACFEAQLCIHPDVCPTWKDVKCPSNSTGTGRRELFSDAEVEDRPAPQDTEARAPRPAPRAAPPAAPLANAAAHLDQSAWQSVEDLEDRFECVDTPDHLLKTEAGRLSLPAESCLELRVIGACTYDMVNELCAKTCGACDDQEFRRHRMRRSLKRTCG